MKKQLVILVCYLNFGNISEQKSRERLGEFSELLNKKAFPQEVQDETETVIRTILIPVKDQYSAVECIYPTYSQTTEQEMFDKIHDLQEEVKKLLEQ